MTYSEPARTTPRRIRIRRLRVAGLLVVRRGDRRGPRPPVAGVLASPSSRHRRLPARPHRDALARPTVPSPTARRSSTTRFRAWPSSTPICSAPCAGPRPMPRTTGSGSSSTAAGVPRRTRSNSSDEAISKYGSEAEAARWVATPDTVRARVGGRGRRRARPVPRRGCPSTAPRTGCAGSTATSPGTTNCARRPSIAAARPCTPTRPTIQGCSMIRSHGRWPPLPLVALIGAGCGSDAPSETGTAHRRRRKKATGQEQGGEVRRVHAGERRPRLPGPGPEGRVRVSGSSVTVRGVDEGRQRVQGPAATGLAELEADAQAADGEPQVRPVHPRERREGLPGPRQRRAARQHLQDPVLQPARWHGRSSTPR